MKKRLRATSQTERVARLARWSALTAFLLLAPVIASAAPWYEHYALADEAIAKEDWNEAVLQLNEAIQRRGDSGAHIRSYGMKVISYFPYLKLGIAYHNLGQHDAAIRAFETEERLGAIQDSPEDFVTMESFRRLAQGALTTEADRLAQERARIASEGLSAAQRFEDAGDIDGALREVSRVLAVMPDNTVAQSALTRLRAESARLDNVREERTRLASLVNNGRAALAAGNYESAVSLLAQAVTGFDAPGIGDRPRDLDDLLRRAQEGLRTELATAPDDQDAIASVLEEARRLELAGDEEGALGRLQRVLALDPSNQGALELQRSLLARREQVSHDARLGGLVAEMTKAFDDGQYEDSLGVANRILALDSGNASALDVVRRAYVEVGRRLLGSGTSGNLPPAISFADYRETRDDGSRVQIVHESEFRLSGITIDDAETDLSFSDQSDRELNGAVRNQLVGDYHIAEFTVSLDLDPGTTTIRVRAVDPDGLASSSEYHVTYAPPLVDRLWFRTTVIALVAAMIIAMMITRRMRRKRLRTRRYNPYIAGAPVLSEDLFFGREQLVRRILQTIHNNSLLLHGERRIGKTSLQHHLRKRLLALEDPAYRFYPVLIDLQGVPEDRFFATLIDEIEEQLVEPLSGTKIPSGVEGRDDYDYRKFVADLRVVLNTLREGTSRNVKLVLLIDEVDELNDYDPRVNQRLRSLFMKSFAENLVAIVSGVQIKKNWEREASPWYNFFEEIEVRPFARDDVEALVRNPIAGLLGIEDGLIDRIVAVTGGKPYLVQRLCVALVNHVYDEGRRVITCADVDAVGAPEVS